MSHRALRLVTGAVDAVTDRHVWRFLTRIDEDLAARQAREPCPHCGVGRLHRADYPRAAWGLPRELRADARRISLCCGAPRVGDEPVRTRFAISAAGFMSHRCFFWSGFYWVGAPWACRGLASSFPSTGAH